MIQGLRASAVVCLASVLPAQQPVAVAPAGLRLPAIFGDHMVLQQQTEAPVWGHATPGAVVQARGSWSEHTVEATAGSDGRFALRLPTPAAGGPFQLELRCGDSQRRLDDVLVGEVWLGSGQSNMEMPLGAFSGWRSGIADHDREIAKAQHPQLRLFLVARHIAAAPAFDVDGEWQVCSPDSAGPFSAAAYCFARDLQQQLQLPVGIIASSWGGTVAQAWTSRQGLGAFPEFAEQLAEVGDSVGETDEQLAARQQRWWAQLGQEQAAPALADAGWSTQQLPQKWSATELAAFDGVAWYRRRVAVPADFVGKELTLELGAIDDLDRTFVDGQRVGGLQEAGSWQTERRYRVPASLVHAGELQLAVCVVDTGGEGGFCSEAARLQLRCGERAVPLAGAWRVQRAQPLSDLPRYPTARGAEPNLPTVLWNGMIAPLVPFALRGFLWYQGESNRYDADQYRRLFPAMITDWRRHWGAEAPFYFVQIAPFGYDDDHGETAQLRAAQAAALALPRTGMAVTMDVGDERDIHPKDKQTVGRRLMLLALAKTYGRQLECEGPTAQTAAAEAAAVRVRFAHADGLAGDAAMQQFELAGADGGWQPASARIDGSSVVVQAAAVPAPQAVRYGWKAYCCGDLHNAAGLPAPPFVLTVSR